MTLDKKEKDKDKSGNTLTKYAYYSGLGFQMIAMIGIFTYIGYAIDERLNIEKPIFTAILSLLGVCMSLYSVIRSVNKRQ